MPGGESRRIGFDASRRRFKLGKTFGRGREIPGSFGGNSADEDHGCPQSISFQNLVASMPRWVLSSKTKFAHFLSRSFHIKCGGSAPSTVVFPLPLADFGIFESRGPKLSQRRWRCLLKKRMLHLVIVAINFLHDGMTIREMDLLGRRPNSIQRAMHKRLWSLIATCDSPGSFAINPGRSGNELIARLRWLEDFAKTCPLVTFGSYGGGPEDLEEKGPQKCHGGAAPVGASCEYGEGDLAPYRPLDAGRLKLTGRGEWDLASHLHDEFWLPYVEPAILQHGVVRDDIEGPDFRLESPEENLKLAKLWSAQGLLCLSESPPGGGNFSRVFNNLKNEKIDRQIGDRRLMNAAERSISGPSKNLPGGYMMTSLHCPPGYCLRGIVTDRKDFYHQDAVTRERAKTNCLPFSVDIQEFKETTALKEMQEALAGRGKDRTVVGDCYGKPKRRSVLVEQSYAFPCFASLFQGDHLGVEFALSSHASMLEDAGLLRKKSRVLGHSCFPAGPLYEGLVIDDYFAVSRRRVGDEGEPEAVTCLNDALGAYQREGVLGSPEKDVIDSRHFKVVGAEINCSEKAGSLGLSTVSAPITKRMSMTALSLKVAALPVVSRGLMSRLVGSWTSIIMYRRCLAATMSAIFQYGVQGEKKESELLHLSRTVAQELTLLAIFSFVATTDISVPYKRRIYATDASMRKGAVVSREVSEDVARAVWLGGDKKGAYTKLENPFASALRNLGFESEREADELPTEVPTAGLDFSFDFCEVCGGSGVVSKEAAKLGMTVCPPIELSNSRHYDIGDVRLMEWLCFMITTGRIRSCMFEPPCTTFSPAAHPAVRSYAEPLGFDRMLWKTWLGNLLAFRCFILMLVSMHAGRPCLLEQPFLSKMAWLSIWAYLKKCGFLESSVASCAFGSPHLKKFRLLHYKLDGKMLSAQCPQNHTHIRIEGKYTKASAVYVPALARRFAEAFHLALTCQKREETEELGGPKIESVVLNDLLAGGDWKVDLQWFWKVPSHINVLESHGYLALLRLLALEGGDVRFSALIDSQVAKCCHAKGRSSSIALTPSLRKAAAIQVSCGLYGSLGYAPTRLNVADDPTRDVALRPPADRSILEDVPFSSIQKLHSLQFSRVAAGWLRLVILLGFLPAKLHATSTVATVGNPSFVLDFAYFTAGANWIFPILLIFGIMLALWILATYQLPPVSLRSISVPQKPPKGLGKQLFHRSRCPLILTCLFAPGAAMDTDVRTVADRQRAARRSGNVLHTDRVMRPQTRKRRDKLIEDFESWALASCGVSVVGVLDAVLVDAEAVATMLVAYGKSLYYAGRPYGVYSESINAVVSRRGCLRCQLGTAWDLAFSWVADEPASHHPAMPASVLLAISSLAMLWAWPVEAGIFLLTWAGLLRIGEVIGAFRRDLILPQDAAPGTLCALLRITTPKTRGRAARHQSARIDQSDLVEYLAVVFGHYKADQKLWPMSASTLRKRLNLLQSALGLPTAKSHDSLPFDLGSFRPGGATDMLQRFEDSELVRRRGRWVSTKVLEIYLQEVSTAVFRTKLDRTTRSRIDRLAQAFTAIRLKVQENVQAKIPLNAWQHLWSTPAFG